MRVRSTWDEVVVAACISMVVAACGSISATNNGTAGVADDASMGRDAEAPAQADSGSSPDAASAVDVGSRDAGPVDEPDAASPEDGGAPEPDAGPPLPPRTPWPMGTRYIQSGHSLTDTVMSNPYPGRLTAAVRLDPNGDFHDVGKATIPGAPIWWRWTHRESGGDQSVQWPEEMNQWEGLVITPAVPLYADDVVRQRDTVDWLLTAVNDAWQNGDGGAGAPTLLYTTWTQLEADPNEPHPEDHLTFRQRLDRDNARWEDMQDFVNANRPSGKEPVYMIPGHRLMMRVWDDIQAGTAPFSDIADIFFDNIHPNDIGCYGVTLLHYAVIYGRDPGTFLPDTLLDADTLTPEQAQYFKRIVPQIVTGYPRTGLTNLSTR